MDTQEQDTARSIPDISVAQPSETGAIPVPLHANQAFHDETMAFDQLTISGASKDHTVPLHPQASPRPSPTHSARSSFSVGGSSETSEPYTEASEPQSPTRGRTLARITPHRTTNRRMTTIHRDMPKMVEWNNYLVQQRLTSRDLTAEPQCFLDLITEPLPLGVEIYRSSLSEELYKTATWGSSVDISRFGLHRDTFAIINLHHQRSHLMGLPDMFFKRLLPHINFETYLAIRLSCRCWSEAITRARPLVTPAVSHVPPEILEKIYTHLDPINFNAARHTCRAWMITSLEERLLTLMLKRGGWSRAAKADMELQEDLQGPRTNETANEEWMLSRRLATECSLRPSWTGHGLPRQIPSSPSHVTLASSSLNNTSTVDFSELGNGYSPVGDCRHRSALHFTVSVCDRFIMVAEGCLVYVYSIQDSTSPMHRQDGYLSAFTTVVCPHRVLAVSMDTSSDRIAIAVLMEGRMGMVCDVYSSSAGLRKPSSPRVLPTAIRDSRGPMYSPRSSSDHVMTEATNPHTYAALQIANDRAMARAIAEATLPEIHGARNTRQSWTMHDPFLSPIEVQGPSRAYEISNDQMPLATGPRSIYHHLCSSEDPPRSVAICPQRHCVAFGCAAGIELHWIDALTGQDLNRWFPLTAPSDFLYFLPPRPGVDSAKKLRLISSAAHPSEREGLQSRFFPNTGSDAAQYHSMTWDEEFHGIGLSGSAWRGSGWCDHYQAVPVSDGWNILFTNPEDGVLCLGSDAPPGARATKLSRRFSFAGPIDADGSAVVPRVYSAGSELRWGVRVVVGYGEALWLFVIPPDIYFADKVYKGADDVQPAEADGEEPIKIEGVEFGKIPALVDVAMDSSAGDVTIWAFAADGMASVWQIGADNRPERQRMAASDGTIIFSPDADGDTFMRNNTAPAVHFDGNASMPIPTHDSAYDRIIDKDGDISMPDVDEDEGYASEYEAAGGKFAIHAPPLWGRWSEDETEWVPGYLESRGSEEDEGVDVLELARVEVEVICG